MAGMKINRDRFSDIYANVEIPGEDREYFSSLASPLAVAVFTEDWCGDHVTTTPVLYKLAEDTGRLEVRLFKQDENLDLANSFLPQNRWGTVPVYVFFDGSDMGEVGRFIETAPELVPVLDGIEKSIRDAHPEVPDINADVSTMAQSTRSLLRRERVAFRVSHAREWGRIICRSFRELVAAGLNRGSGEPPAVGGTEWPPP
jgi:hypothetical protein